MAKKIKDSLVDSKDIKLKKVKKEPKPKDVSVEQLHPKAHNKDSLTENIQSRSSKAVKDAGLGKITRMPLNQHLDLDKKK